MNIELREDSVVIKGYINAVDRDSKVMQFESINNGNQFVEQVVDGVWQRALEKNKDVKVLLNHKLENTLGSTQDTLKLKEDSIGLYGEFRTCNADVIKKAKEKRLVGWSFGFSNAKESWGKTDTNIDRRYLNAFDLSEVSLLDDTKIPAYTGCCVFDEQRSTEETPILNEYRCTDNVIEDNVDDVLKQEEEQRTLNEQRELEAKLKLLELELEL